jgi:hypothetical protein
MWTIRGNRDSLNFKIIESGYQEIGGRALNHDVYTSSYHDPTGEMTEEIKSWYEEKAIFSENLSKLELDWQILPGNAKKFDISPDDRNETTLFERCQAEPEINHSFISYYDFTDDRELPFKERAKSLVVCIILPPNVFSRVWKLFREVNTEPEIEYQISVDHSDWMRQRGPDNSLNQTGKYGDSRLTMEEFLSGKEYYFNEIHFMSYRRKDLNEKKEVIDEGDNLTLPKTPLEEKNLYMEEGSITLSTIKRSLNWIKWLLILIATILIFK